MLTNNEILKKLRVALQLKDDDILSILDLVDFKITKGALGDLFRTEDHPGYVEAGDQILRNFLNGLVIYNRGPLAQMEKSGSQTKSSKYQPNIIPKLEMKKPKQSYSPYIPKDRKPENSAKFIKEESPAAYKTKPMSKIENKNNDVGSKLGKSFFKKDHFKK